MLVITTFTDSYNTDIMAKKEAEIRDYRFSSILLIAITGLAIIVLFLEFGTTQTLPIIVLINILDFILLFLFIADIVIKAMGHQNARTFMSIYWFDTLFLLVFAVLFIASKYIFFRAEYSNAGISSNLMLIRNIFVILKIITRISKMNELVKRFTTNPAQTMILSFFFLIIAGALLLILPYSVNRGQSIGIIDAFFTSVSAVCVTGLITVDTQTTFSLFGKTVIMLLIQSGGLGIMLFGFLTAFIMRKKISVEDKMAVQYMVNAQNMRDIENTVIKIITFTFIIEFVGTIILFPAMQKAGNGVPPLFNALFHSVSAFCNAGFALFSDSLESFQTSLSVNATVMILIILGGLGFSVMDNLFKFIHHRIVRKTTGKSIIAEKLSLNTKVVIIMTFLLILTGAFLIYGFEHGRHMSSMDMDISYMASFFQSVTLRTAGFNTLGIGALSFPVIVVMMIFMFIGGGAGSTAGGVKVNTIAVIGGYIKSLLNRTDDTVIFKEFISKAVVLRAFTIVFIGILIVIAAFFILSITERQSARDTLFEVISAFGTVGLSTGITSELTLTGKLVIMLTMFAGRLGFLTIISALSKAGHVRVQYPTGYVNIG